MAIERFPVEATHILMFARAIGDPNPAFTDPDSAEARSVGGVVAPPTFVMAGWQFDADGTCVDMPNVPDQDQFRHKVRARAFPVAEQAGLVWVYLGPRDVPPPLPQLEDLLEKLEEGRSQTGGIAAGLDALPLFAAAPQAPEADPLADALDALDPDALTPREALDALYRLKALSKE